MGAGSKHPSEQTLMEYDKQNLTLEKIIYGFCLIDKQCKIKNSYC